MTTNQRNLTFSRRKFIATSLASGIGIILVRSVSGQPLASDLPVATPQELLEIIISQADPELSTAALVEVFARSGIAVFDDEVTAPLVAPTNPISPLSFQQWQLAAMVSDIATGGRPAADLDVMFPTETEAGDALPTVGELMIGYAAGATTPGAAFAHAWLDTFVTDDMSITAADIPIPAIFMSLLGGEIMGQVFEAGQTAAIAPRNQSSFAAFAQLPGLDLPTLPAIPQIPNVSIPPLPSAGGSTICGQAQSFISIVQQRIFSVLDTADEIASVPILGEITSILKKGVQLGLGLILKAVDIALAPVTSIVKTVGAALAIASLIIGTITPWTVTLNLKPTRTRFGIDAEVVTGDIGIVAGGWDRINWPPVIEECASFVGLALPNPTATGAPVNMWVSQPRPLIVLKETTTALDNRGQAAITYATQNETSEQAKGKEVIGIAWITAKVERDDLKKLRNDLMNLLFSQLPDIIAKIVRPIVGPIADSMSDKLIDLATASGRQPLFVTFHTPKDEDPDLSDDDASNCIIGRFQVKDPAVVIRKILDGVGEIDVTGALISEFMPDGTVQNSYDGLVLTMAAGPGVDFTFAFSGQEIGTYTADNGVLSITITSSTVAADADMVAFQAGVGGAGVGTRSGPYICGNPVIWQLTDPVAGEIEWEFIPLD